MTALLAALLLLAAPCPAPVDVVAGTTAPCDGTLLGAPDMAEMLQAAHDARRLTAELVAEQGLHAADLALAAERAASARQLADEVLAAEVRRRQAAETGWRETVAPEPVSRWTPARVVAVVVAGAVALAAGVPCARGDAGWCAVSGASVGAGVALAL